MPDIDTDFDDEGQQKVIEYVVDKYGKNQVAQLITFGTMAAKMSIKDGRVLTFRSRKPTCWQSMFRNARYQPGTGHACTVKGEGSLAEREFVADEMTNIQQPEKDHAG